MADACTRSVPLGCFGVKTAYCPYSISQKPLITPDLFVGLVGNKEVELHPEQRDSVYSVAGSPVYDSSGNLTDLEFIVSRGDTLTFTVTVPISILTKGWPSNQEITSLHLLSDAA